MGANNQDNRTTEFMLTEYQDLYENVMHLENKLFNHLSFYTTLFMGIVTASVAIYQLVGDAGSWLTRPSILAVLSLVFVLFAVVGRFELRMTMELRVRKMKFIEGLTQLRQYFVDKDPTIAPYLVLPVGMPKAPPYLRVRSQDWYQVVYMSFMNGLVVFVAWILPLWLLVAAVWQMVGRVANWMFAPPLVPEGVAGVVSALVGLVLAGVIVPVWVIVGLFLWYLASWEFSYRTMMEFCADYDESREARMGKPTEYDLLERPAPRCLLRRSLGDWIWLIEQRRRAQNEQSHD
jgi:hypothetical protein